MSKEISEPMLGIAKLIDKRSANKILLSSLCALIVLNWRPMLFLVFERTSIEKKIEHFDANTTIISTLVLPLAIGFSVALVMPWIKHLSLLFDSYAEIKTKRLENKNSHLDLMDKMKYETARLEMQRNFEQSALEAAKVDLEATKIENEEIKKQLQQNLKEIRILAPDFNWMKNSMVEDYSAKLKNVVTEIERLNKTISEIQKTLPRYRKDAADCAVDIASSKEAYENSVKQGDDIEVYSQIQKLHISNISSEAEWSGLVTSEEMKLEKAQNNLADLIEEKGRLEKALGQSNITPTK